MDLSPYHLPDTFEDVDVPKAFPVWWWGPMWSLKLEGYSWWQKGEKKWLLMVFWGWQLTHTVDGSEIRRENHLDGIKPCKQWDKLPTSTGEFTGFLPFTVWFIRWIHWFSEVMSRGMEGVQATHDPCNRFPVASGKRKSPWEPPGPDRESMRCSILFYKLFQFQTDIFLFGVFFVTPSELTLPSNKLIS